VDAHVEAAWTRAQDAYLRSMVACVMAGGTQWASTSHGGWHTRVTFPRHADFAKEAQVSVTSSAK
jgi:hypothetical protein